MGCNKIARANTCAATGDYSAPMETFSGLPAHPLFVHAPLVLLPLVALLTVIACVRSGWHRRWTIPLTAATGVLLVMLFASNESGEFLAEELGLQRAVGDHEELAEQTMILTLLMFLGHVAAVVLSRLARRARGARALAENTDEPTTTASWLLPTSTVIRFGTAAVAVLATFWIFRTGHEGASVVWDGWNN